MIYPETSQSCQIPGLNTFYQYYFCGKSDGVFVEVGANDGQSWYLIPHSSATINDFNVSVSSFVDLCEQNSRYVRAKVDAPKSGAVKLKITVNGK